MRIICGMDLTPASDAALIASIALSRRLAPDELLLAHAVDLPPSMATLAAGEAAHESARKLLESAAARIPAAMRPRCAVVEGRPGPALLEIARPADGDLIVAGCGGHLRTSFLGVGGTAETLAQSARVAVLVVRAAGPFAGWVEDRPLRIVIGCDGHLGGAVELVRVLREKGPCKVTAAHVYDPFEASFRYGLPGRASLVEPRPELEALLERDLRKKIQALGEVDVRLCIGLGRKGDHLLQMAAQAKADVLVLGARRRGALARFGSTLSVALRFAPCSVLSVPQTERATLVREHPTPRCILVASDLSPATASAVAYAAAIAGPGGQLHGLHVAAPSFHPDDAALASRLAELGGPDLHVHVVRSGDAARAIWEVAERIGADAVVVAGHLHGELHRVLVGSVGSDVIQNARRPVIVLPPLE